MTNAESLRNINRELNQTLEYINDTAVASGTPRGEVALDLLRQKNMNPSTKRVALLVRTQEVIRLNRQDKTRPSGS